MHIAFLTPEYSSDQKPEGGLGNYLRKTAIQLIQRGHRVSVFCLSQSELQSFDGEVRIYNVKRFRFANQLTRWSRIASLLPVVAQVRSAQRVAKKFWRINSTDPFDIVQSASYATPGLFIRKNGRIPDLCRISSYTPFWRSATGQKRTFGDYLRDWLEVRQVIDAQAAFAPSEHIAKAFHRIEACQPRVIRSPANVDEVAFDSSFYQQHLRGQSYLLYFGTLNEVKGVDLMAPVASMLFPKYPDVRIAFIGRDHGCRHGKKMFDYICEFNPLYRARLFYHPGLPKSQLYPIIQNAKGVIMPSRVDNYPNACLEAISLGVPVIGTYDSSIEEIIDDNETGFLGINDNAESFFQAIERLLRLSPVERQELCERILACSRRIHSEDRVGQLVAFYSETSAAFRHSR